MFRVVVFAYMQSNDFAVRTYVLTLEKNDIVYIENVINVQL